MILITLALALFLGLSNGILPPPSRASPDFAKESLSTAPYEVHWYKNQQLDHFNFETHKQTWSERYLVNLDNWGNNPQYSSSQCRGPIFFYTGNEGDITWFWNNTGFLTDTLAQTFGAAIIFGEHRYYGESLPFGKESYVPQYLGYLTSEQALADYAQLIPYLKKKMNATACPVIAFGGSYGGMLAGWFRMKYPNIVAGALSASAPIFQFYGSGVSHYVFYEIVTNDYSLSGSACSDGIKRAFIELINMSNASGLARLSQEFQLCTGLTDVEDLYQWIITAVIYMAMTDYPYPTNFLQPMPGWPVAQFCQIFLNVSSSDGPFVALKEAVGVYYNYTGQAGECYDIYSNGSTPALGIAGWTYQACTEMVEPLAANGKTDMFLPQPFDLKLYSESCFLSYGAYPRPHWVPTYYGANLADISAASNIVFSNGDLDPWMGGGVTQNISESLIAVVIKQAAHHLDLRLPNVLDPVSVQQARQLEISEIAKWIAQYYSLTNKN